MPVPSDVEMTWNVGSIIMDVTVDDELWLDLLHEVDHVSVHAGSRLVDEQLVTDYEPIMDVGEACCLVPAVSLVVVISADQRLVAT